MSMLKYTYLFVQIAFQNGVIFVHILNAYYKTKYFYTF